MKNLIPVSVGIPAYNEQNGIRRVLTDILRQKLTAPYELTEVAVYCDGCSDDTAKVARSVKDSRIKVIDSQQRLGKTQRLQQMFQQLKGDYIITVDSDIECQDDQLLIELLKKFRSSNVALVAGNVQAALPKTFVQRAVYSTFQVFDNMRKKDRRGNNLYSCGACLAMTKSFARSLKFPKIINEDIFIYLSCKQQGLEFRCARKAVIFYKLPLNFRDYMKQILRSEPIAMTAELRPYFPEIIDQEAARDQKQYLKEVVNVFLHDPLAVSAVIFINLICRPFMTQVITHYNLNWFTAKSTH